MHPVAGPTSDPTERDKGYLVIAYVFSFLVCLLSFTAVWLRYPEVMYLGRDADYSLWNSSAYRLWADALDVTAINPLQGMTSMLVAINPYFNPGAWVFNTGLPDGAKSIISFMVYFMEVAITTFLLGRRLGFTRPFALIGSLWLVLLLFPPFNFLFGLQGWIGTAPLYGHTLALCNLILIAFTYVGNPACKDSHLKNSILVNCLLIACIFALVLVNLLAAPFYNGGMLIGLTVGGGAIFLSSSTPREFLWRIAAGIVVAACLNFLGLVDFFLSARSYSARFALASLGGHSNPLDYVSNSNLDSLGTAKAALCAMGVACERMSGRSWSGLIGSYWIHLATLCGGLALAFSGQRPLSRTGLCFACIWATLLGYWSLVSFRVLPMGQISPVYFYLMAYPFVAFLSLYSLVFVIQRVVPDSLFPQWRAGVKLEFAISTAVAMGSVALALFANRSNPADVVDVLSRTAARPTTPIVDVLKREITLLPGEPYRGSVATILGVPGGSLRPLAGLTPSEPLKTWQFMEFARLARDSGTEHDLLDLWWLNIPTLSEYGQGVSIPLMFYITRFLSRSGDPVEPNYALPRVANIEVLRAMGVRFIVTDGEVSGERVTPRQSIRLNNGGNLHLYEIPAPNIGTYSPTEVIPLASVDEFATQIARNPSLLESRAFINGEVRGKLVPARNARLRFVKGGLELAANSDGRSAILLPIQYSHCYELAGPSKQNATVMRANILHALVVFDGNLDLRLNWTFDFWGNSKCRIQDVQDLKFLGLL